MAINPEMKEHNRQVRDLIKGKKRFRTAFFFDYKLMKYGPTVMSVDLDSKPTPTLFKPMP